MQHGERIYALTDIYVRRTGNKKLLPSTEDIHVRSFVIGPQLYYLTQHNLENHLNNNLHVVVHHYIGRILCNIIT